MTKHSKQRVFLSETDKENIRKSKHTADKLAEIYNVSVNTIYYILRPKRVKRPVNRIEPSASANTTMTKAQALDAMQSGQKITHRFFSPDEWMTIDNGKILLEDGVRCMPNDFFKYRSDKSWNDGYSLYKRQ